MIVDTHILIWLLTNSRKLSSDLRNEITSRIDDPVFSTVSIWEVAIKFRRNTDFAVDPAELRSQLLVSNWTELPFTGEHAVAVRDLPPIHADPFDRALLAQAIVEKMELVTADSALIGYGSPVRGM